jgi:hypothetical protein
MVLKIKQFVDVPVQEPEIPHFHASGFLAFYSVVDNAHCGRVVAMNGGGGLRVPQLF